MTTPLQAPSLLLPAPRLCAALGALCLVAALGLARPAAAQRVIEPGPPGTIDSIILSDTTDTGERAETHYILRRGGIYIYNRQITNVGWPLTVEAEEGDGPRPLIKAYAQGDESPRQFRPRGNLTLRGLHLDGYDNFPGGGRPTDNAIVRGSAEGIRIIIDDCIIDRNRQSAMRADSDQIKWYITNTIFSNVYNDGRPDQSFILDTRGNAIDTALFVNTTIYNHPGRILRSPEAVEYLRMEHVTMVNIGGVPQGGEVDTVQSAFIGEDDVGAVNFGQTSELIFKNNLVINPGYYGAKADPLYTPEYALDLDSVVVNESEVVPPEMVEIRNNNVYFAPSIAEAYPDSAEQFVLFDPTVEAYIEQQGARPTFLSEAIDFGNAPGPPVDFVEYYYFDPLGSVPPLLNMDSRYVPREDYVASFYDLDFSYPATAASYAASTRGQPLGDLNWFGLEIAGTEVPIGQGFAGGNAGADGPALSSYPNPFSASTTIRYRLDRAAKDVRLDVFNVLGQKVAALVGEAQPAGSHEVTLQAAHLASGVYFARLTADGEARVRQMVLVK